MYYVFLFYTDLGAVFWFTIHIQDLLLCRYVRLNATNWFPLLESCNSLRIPQMPDSGFEVI